MFCFLKSFPEYGINLKQISADELLEPIKSIANDRSTRFAFL